MIVFASPNLHFIEIQCKHTVVKAIIIISIYNLGTKCQTPSKTKHKTTYGHSLCLCIEFASSAHEKKVLFSFCFQFLVIMYVVVMHFTIYISHPSSLHQNWF